VDNNVEQRPPSARASSSERQWARLYDPHGQVGGFFTRWPPRCRLQ
jgi:hypothetical protein